MPAVDGLLSQRIAVLEAQVEALSQRVEESRPDSTSYRNRAWGKAKGTITEGGTGTMTVWLNDPTSGKTSTELDITVSYDVIPGGDISDGKEMAVEWYEDEELWRVVRAECEDFEDA